MGNSNSATPIFNKKFQILSLLGEGKTSFVFLISSLEEPSSLFALKVLKKTYIKNKNSLKNARNEMEIHSKLFHQNIVKVHSYGENGKLKNGSSRKIKGLFYIIMDYVPVTLFDVIQHSHGVGEDAGRFFFK